MRRVDTIKQLVSQYFEINPMHLVGHRRCVRYVRPRQIAYYLCYKHSDMSYSCIAAAFGKDHTTVISGVKRIEKLMQVDEELRDNIDDLTKWLPWIIAIVKGGQP